MVIFGAAPPWNRRRWGGARGDRPVAPTEVEGAEGSLFLDPRVIWMVWAALLWNGRRWRGRVVVSRGATVTDWRGAFAYGGRDGGTTNWGIERIGWVVVSRTGSLCIWGEGRGNNELEG